MKVLLTGATGFVGSHVARTLVQRGTEVFALVRPGSDTWRIDDIADGFNLVSGDLADGNAVDQLLRTARPDLCIHCAWGLEPTKYLNSFDNLDLLASSLQFVSKLESAGCQRFVGVGTCFEYDTSLEFLSEESATRPNTLYAGSKLALAITLDQVGRLGNMSTAWARLFYLYGPREDPRRLVASVIASLLKGEEGQVTEGKQIRDFMHVADVAAAICAVANADLVGPVNIGSGEPIAVRDIVARIGAITGRTELIRFGALPHNSSDPMFICANNRLLIEETSWSPRFDLDQGLRHTVAWWNDHVGSPAGTTPLSK